MLTEVEAIEKLETKIADFYPQRPPYYSRCSIYNELDCFAEYTLNQIKKQQLDEVKSCFCMVDELYHSGCRCVKDAISNVYLYALAPMLDNMNEQRSQVICLLSNDMAGEWQRLNYLTFP